MLWAVACSTHAKPELLGTLEWDRASVVADAPELVVKIEKMEGDWVHAGDLVLELDSRRLDAQLARARAQQQLAQAQLAALRHGARAETIDAVRAEVASADAQAANASQEQQRSSALRRTGVITQSEQDRANAVSRSAAGAARSARAKLAELLNGTRPEDLEQGEAALAAAHAEEQLVLLNRERLSVRAPRDGRIDALPFRLGDQPPAGAIVLSMLVGNAPYARVYVPASRRAQLAIGAVCSVHVEGITAPFTARLRSLRSDPAFTPYYALSGDDASRLAYRAELVLDEESAAQLPAGLPLQADCSGHAG